MKIPERYRSLSLGEYPIFGELCDADGSPTAWPHHPVYPPPGFLPISLFEYGNGDVNGFYWPIGCEDKEPIVCSTYHDDWGIEPQASDMEGFLRTEVVRRGWSSEDEEYTEPQEIARQLGVTLPRADDPSDIQGKPDLALDPKSPAVLRAEAADAIRQGNLDLAETYLKTALDVLPEYTAAQSDLAALLRRRGQIPEAASVMIQVIGSPICFGGDRGKSLQWLRRLKEQDFPELTSDPLWQSRHRLTFKTGVKHNDDFLIYEDAIAEYLSQGRGVRAIRLRVLMGELMWGETVSFRERYGFTPDRYRELLIDDLRAAGLEKRLPCVTGAMDAD